MLGLPADFEGVIADHASTTSLLAIAAARDAVAPEIRALGMVGCGGMPKLRLYSSEQAHSSIEKGAMMGIGQENVRKIFRPGFQRACERISGRRTDWTSAA
ncbi:MAG: pyridoxal-dependent decarboxylase [Methylocella sp.]